MMSRYEMIQKIKADGNLFYKNFCGISVNNVIGKLQNEELREVIENKNHKHCGSWFDLYLPVSKIFNTNVSKDEIKFFLTVGKKYEDLNVDEFLELPPSTENLKKLLERWGYKLRKNMRKSQLCKMLDIPDLVVKIGDEIRIVAFHEGFKDAYFSHINNSCDYLKIQRNPKTINEWANVDEKKFNSERNLTLEKLKKIIHHLPKTNVVCRSLMKEKDLKYYSSMTTAEMKNQL